MVFYLEVEELMAWSAEELSSSVSFKVAAHYSTAFDMDKNGWIVAATAGDAAKSDDRM